MIKKLFATAFVAFFVAMATITGFATEYTVTPDTIQQVLMNCNDSPENPITIRMQAGAYNPIILKDRKHYISLIGDDNVMVISNVGTYAQPAAELWLDGEVRNITFISRHPEGMVNMTDNGAYAVHMDYGQQNVRITGCQFISYQTAAVGMGLTSDSNAQFQNCTFANKANGTFGSTWKLGAFYAHTDKKESVKNGAKLSFDKCAFEAPKGAFSKTTIEELNGTKLNCIWT